MMINLTSFILILITCELVFGKSTCGCTSTTKKFYISIEKANFFQAFINCKIAGMELAAIENEEESTTLNAYLNPYKVEGYENGFWLSGSNLNSPTSKLFYWLPSGKPVLYSKWHSTEPNNYLGRQNCMTWAQYQGKTGWADDGCEVLLRYICEYKSGQI